MFCIAWYAQGSGSVTVARKRTLLFIINILGRDLLRITISGLRLWKNWLGIRAGFFTGQIWAVERIEQALLK